MAEGRRVSFWGTDCRDGGALWIYEKPLNRTLQIGEFYGYVNYILIKLFLKKKSLLKKKVKRPSKKVLMLCKMKENKMPRFLPS